MDEYWLTSPRGIEVCLSCKREVCYYDEKERQGELCPDLKESPKVEIGQRHEILKFVAAIIKEEGPMLASELNEILKRRHNVDRHFLYSAIKDNKLMTEHVEATNKRYGYKIIVLGVKEDDRTDRNNT